MRSTTPTLPSPAKRRHDSMSPSLPVSLQHKRLRTLATPSLDPLYAFVPSANLDAPADDEVVAVSNGLLAGPQTFDSTSSALNASYSILDAETQSVRLALNDAMNSGKGTEAAYLRHVKNYIEFMVQDQAERSQTVPGWVVIPPMPITARNVAAFLEMETKRTKKNSDGVQIPGTRVGVQSIKQCISALESWRHNHEHEYPNNPDALKSLRNDNRIRTFERSANESERQRNADSQITKAKGSNTDTFTREEIIKGSMWAFKFQGTKAHVHLGLRDRAMLLLSTALAFRGDNIRALLLSDLSFQDVHLLELGPDATAMALVCFSDQGKTNTNGRIDEQAAFRHRIPELCPVGGLGFYFFSLFHILREDPPDFEPDFSTTSEVGFRKWYRIVLFPGSGGKETEMTYENHRKRVLELYKHNDITIRKVTHAGRPFAAATSREHGASVDDTKALGNWSQGTLRNCYDRTLPVDAMLAAAAFNGKKHESYFVSRNVLQPPSDLLATIFPWVEKEQSALNDRFKKHGKRGVDVTLTRFLLLLARLRLIILQDAAALYQNYPSLSIYQFPPFNTPEFRAFASSAASTIQRAETDAKNQLASLPETVASSLRGILAANNIQQEQIRDQLRFETAQLNTQFQALNTLVQSHILQPNPRRRKTTKSTMAPLAPSSPLYILPAAIATPSAVTGSTSASENAPILSAIPTILNASTMQTTPTILNAPIMPTIPSILSTDSTKQSTVSLSGNIYSSLTFGLSGDPADRDKQLAYIAFLEERYSYDRLARHTFDWISSSTTHSEDEYLPHYQYWRPKNKLASPTICQIWEEWMYGIDGFLSVSQLTATWGARWRRNNSAAKTEASRRKKVTTLIDTLAKRPNWNVDRALKFLESTYPIPTPSIVHLKNTRAFIDRLQKKDLNFMEEIENAANGYHLH